jgi:hypothetical protein
MESTDARVAFPCFDEPSYKATFDLTAMIDKADTAISNGEIVSDTPGPGDKHTIKFATSPKMSSYLVALTVGDWKCVSDHTDGVKVSVCTVPGKENLARSRSPPPRHSFTITTAITESSIRCPNSTTSRCLTSRPAQWRTGARLSIAKPLC